MNDAMYVNEKIADLSEQRIEIFNIKKALN